MSSAGRGTSARSRVQRAGALAVVGLVGAALAVLAAEALLPSRGAGACGGGTPPLWRPRLDLGWALRPGASGDAVVCAGDAAVARETIEINALGQRDRPRSLARDGARPRVLVLGDSLVEATQVALGETFAARVEAASGIEMLNAGVSGYSTDNQLRFFTATGASYRPDLVLLVLFVGNDVAENGARLFFADPHGLPPKPWLRAAEGSPWLRACLAVHRATARVAAAVPDALWERSRLVRAATTSAPGALLRGVCAGAVGPRAIDGGPERLGVYGEPATLAWREGWARTEDLLSRLRAAVEASGAGFAVAIAPAGVEIDPRLRVYEVGYPVMRGRALDFDYPHRRLGAWLEAQGVPWISLAEPLRAHLRATGRSGYYPVDGHWNAEGHQVVAQALAPFVRDLASARQP